MGLSAAPFLRYTSDFKVGGGLQGLNSVLANVAVTYYGCTNLFHCLFAFICVANVAKKQLSPLFRVQSYTISMKYVTFFYFFLFYCAFCHFQNSKSTVASTAFSISSGRLQKKSMPVRRSSSSMVIAKVFRLVVVSLSS